jgi:hypothetical protein
MNGEERKGMSCGSGGRRKEGKERGKEGGREGGMTLTGP